MTVIDFMNLCTFPATQLVKIVNIGTKRVEFDGIGADIPEWLEMEKVNSWEQLYTKTSYITLNIDTFNEER